MNRNKHRAWSLIFWTGTALSVDLLAVRTGHALPVAPAAFLVGPALAAPFSAGRPRLDRKFGLSPDIDQIWAPGMPRNNYEWTGHRGFTHRIWFACVLSFFCAVLPSLWAMDRTDPKSWSLIVPLICSPMNGWWSHLAGDMIYGRLKVGVYSWKLGRFWTWNIGLGWKDTA